LWRIFGLATAIPHGDEILQTDVPATESASVGPQSTPELLIPVTGGHPNSAGSFVVYGLLVFGALVLILALLNLSNKPVRTRSAHTPPQDDQ
jgi:hypothetical protein